MKCNPLVSVVMPVYNSEKYIKESIESVLGQTYINYELIIVNDASTDSSMKIVEELSKTSNKIRIVHLLYNQGVSAARNIGIKNAVGEYIAFIDSDDIWLENKLEEQLDFMISNNLKFSFTAYEILHCGTQRPNTFVSVPDVTDYNSLLCGNAVPCFTVICHKSLLNNCSFENIKHEDYVLWLTLAKENKLYGLNKNLGIYREHNKSISSNKLKAASWVWHIYREHEKLGFWQSSFFFVKYAIQGVRKHYLK